MIRNAYPEPEWPPKVVLPPVGPRVTRLITDPTDSKTHKQDPLQKFMKLFKTSNMEIVNYCQRLFGCDLRNTLLSRRSRQRERLSASMLSICLLVCLSVCRQKTKTRFSQKPSNLEPWSPLTTYRKSYMGFSKNPLLDPWWRRSAILDVSTKMQKKWFSVKLNNLRAVVSTDDL